MRFQRLPGILAEFPEVVYIVLGATHPNEVREHGGLSAQAIRATEPQQHKKKKTELVGGVGSRRNPRYL